jgi:uncharacterized delta-60 repeat protein
VGGDFNNLGGLLSKNLGRLNPDGTLDTAFQPAIGDTVFSLIVQPDGRILVGGDSKAVPGGTRGALARLYPDGTLDTTFQAAEVIYVETMALQPDGKVIVGGRFHPGPDPNKKFIRRLNADGSLDGAFSADADADFYSIALQTDGRMVVGGIFTNLNGDLRPGLGRLNPDGTRDTDFNPLSYQEVWALGLQTDGKILIGALRVPGTLSISRLLNTGPATQSLNSDGMSITWLRGGTSPEICHAEFDSSLDGTAWSMVGTSTRIPGGWRLTGITLPANSYVRARGWVAVGQYNGPAWFVESTNQVALTRPIILSQDGNLGFNAGQFGFDYSANPGQVVIVEGSSDLRNWAPFATNTFGATPLYFSDVASTELRLRFYRLRLGP